MIILCWTFDKQNRSLSASVTHFHGNIIKGLCTYVQKHEEIYDSDGFNEISFGEGFLVIRREVTFSPTPVSSLATNRE